MHKLNRRIEIVCSTVSALSSMGPTSRQGIFEVLSKYYSDVRISIVNTVSDLEAVVARQPDLVFLGMKFVLTEPTGSQTEQDKLWVTDYLSRHDIPHTGSGHVAHTYECSKSLAKQQVQAQGLATAPFYIVPKISSPAQAPPNLLFPLFVKPHDRGGGEGIDAHSVVYTTSQLDRKIATIHSDLNTDVLVEEYLTGREFSVALLRDEKTDELWVMPLEIIAPFDNQGHRVLSAEIKSADTERAISVTDVRLIEVLSDLATGAFEALGAKDYGRIDIRIDRDGEAQFLEANLLPSLLDGYGNFPKACLINKNISYEAMVVRITKLALLSTEVSSQPNIWQEELLAIQPVLLPV